MTTPDSAAELRGIASASATFFSWSLLSALDATYRRSRLGIIAHGHAGRSDMSKRDTWMSRLGVIGLALVAGGCTSTISFRADPAGNDEVRLTCIQSSSGACAFKVFVDGTPTGRTQEVPEGQALDIGTPRSGAEVRGCVANEALSSCSTVHVAAGTVATTDAKSW